MGGQFRNLSRVLVVRVYSSELCLSVPVYCPFACFFIRSNEHSGFIIAGNFLATFESNMYVYRIKVISSWFLQYFYCYFSFTGVRGGTLWYKPEDRGFGSHWDQWEFSLT